MARNQYQHHQVGEIKQEQRPRKKWPAGHVGPIALPQKRENGRECAEPGEDRRADPESSNEADAGGQAHDRLDESDGVNPPGQPVHPCPMSVRYLGEHDQMTCSNDYAVKRREPHRQQALLLRGRVCLTQHHVLRLAVRKDFGWGALRSV